MRNLRPSQLKPLNTAVKESPWAWDLGSYCLGAITWAPSSSLALKAMQSGFGRGLSGNLSLPRFSPNGRSSTWTSGDPASLFHTLRSSVPSSLLLWLCIVVVFWQRAHLVQENLCPGTGTGPSHSGNSCGWWLICGTTLQSLQQEGLYIATHSFLGIVDKGPPVLLMWTLFQGQFLKHRKHSMEICWINNWVNMGKRETVVGWGFWTQVMWLKQHQRRS